MSVAKVLKLGEYRGRRQQRIAMTRALTKVDGVRSALFEHLAEIAGVSGADRVATVWVDEYGPGLVHPFLVLDLLADRPRRHFDVEPLHRAWEFGVPGAHDDVIAPGGTGSSTFAIALGSDGTRAWFVVADSVTARPPLDDLVRDRLMFIAGGSSAIVLHRDLDEASEGQETKRGRFAGWPILRDLQAHGPDEPEASRVGRRFVVARLVRLLVDDDLSTPADRIAEEVAAARGELALEPGLEDSERAHWEGALDAYAAGAMDVLAGHLLRLAVASEQRGHDFGAEELYLCSYRLAAATASAATAADAARSLGRMLRRRARRAEAATWYEGACQVASAAGMNAIHARALSGLATNTREAGNLPKAREVIAEALAIAETSGDASTLASVHRDVVSLEHSAGDFQEAVRHGWLAASASSAVGDRDKGLAVLAGALERLGDYDLAADAWNVVAETTEDAYLQALSLDALAHICAVRGDAEGFLRYAERCDAIGHETIHSAHAQILRYRGLSHRALGELDAARQWLDRAVRFAEEHGYNEILFSAEQDLADLASHVAETVETTPAAPEWIREGVQAMRRDLVGTTA